MKNRIVNLGILLLTILLLFSIGSLVLYFSYEINDLFKVGLGVILLLVVVTLISYLLIDLYGSQQDIKKSSSRSTRKPITHFRNLSEI